MKTQTKIPVKFENLTIEQKLEICNGCGGKGRWITPPHAVFFNTCCDHHDYGYWKGSNEYDRLWCDKKLKESMIDDCLRLSWYKRIRYRPWCELYYIGVRLFGKRFFSYSKNTRYPK